MLYVADEEAEMQLAQDDSRYFLTTPHFAKSRMILVHLDRIPAEELAEVHDRIVVAARTEAPGHGIPGRQ